MVMATAAAVAGTLLMLVLPVDPFVVNFPTGGDSQIPDGALDGTASLLFTTQREMGVVLIWIASLLMASAIGSQLPSLPKIRVALAIAAIVVWVGLILVFLPTFAIGSVATSDGEAAFLLHLTARRAIGFAFIWIASLLVASAIGWRANTKGSVLSDSVD